MSGERDKKEKPAENPTLSSAFSEVYRRSFPAILREPIPDEVHATCHDCAMCNKAEQIAPDRTFFSPRAKCCTYHPNLPNYLVGGLLADDDPALDEGRRRIRARIDARQGISPRGVLAPRKYDLLYRSSQRSMFGRSESMVCPYFERDSGGCTVWRFREAVCSTYFCKYVKGADGKNLWQAAKDYVATMERCLISYALLELGFTADAILDGGSKSLTLDDLDEVTEVTPAYRQQWREWLGREEELYRTTHEIVAALSPDDFRRIGGVNADVRLARVVDRFRMATDPELPAVLRRNPDLRATLGPDGKYQVVSFSDNQPSLLERDLYECLDYFDGRHPVDVVTARLQEERQVNLSTDLLIMLHHFRILVSVPAL